MIAALWLLGCSDDPGEVDTLAGEWFVEVDYDTYADEGDDCDPTHSVGTYLHLATLDVDVDGLVYWTWFSTPTLTGEQEKDSLFVDYRHREALSTPDSFFEQGASVDAEVLDIDHLELHVRHWWDMAGLGCAWTYEGTAVRLEP